MTPVPVVVALGSNLGDREALLRGAVQRLLPLLAPLRVSGLWETEPVDSPAGSPRYLNAIVLGLARLGPEPLLARLLEVERELGRRRGGRRNEPRRVDLDLILYGAVAMRTASLTLPHPRFAGREFVLAPLRELGLTWDAPGQGCALGSLRGTGAVRRAGSLY